MIYLEWRKPWWELFKVVVTSFHQDHADVTNVMNLPNRIVNIYNTRIALFRSEVNLTPLTECR
jgi:hypothetical protein